MEMASKWRKLIEGNSEFLPPEIITEILSRLPADSAIGCKGICKQWRSLIDDPSFRDTHTRQVISSSTSNPKQFGGNSSSSSSSFGFFLCALQENREFHLQFVEYIDHVDEDEELVLEYIDHVDEDEEEELVPEYIDHVDEDEEEELVPEFKPCKPITDNPFPFYNNWGTLMISTCNGLVFMGSAKPNYVNDMFVCNPFTREYVNLCTVAAATPTDENDARANEEERRGRLEKKGFMAYGFGYLPSTNEYKIVSIYYPDRDLENSGYYYEENLEKGKVSIYTLGSGRWRNKGEIPYRVYDSSRPGFFANGAIHWFNYVDKKKIVTFDLANEEFKVVVPLPPRATSAHYLDELGVLGGCLCMTRSDKRTYNGPKDIWVLDVHNKEEQEEFSWNKRFSIPWKGTTSGAAEPHVILRSGKILLRSGFGLISYDPKTGAFDEDNQSIFYDPRLQVIPYTKSFVSLKALGEEDAKCFGGFVSDALAQPSQQQQQG